MGEERLVSREIHLKRRPVGMPTENNFQLVKANIPDLKDDEFLVRNIWMSVDPYMRGRMSETKSYISPYQIGKPLEGSCVGQIIKSNNNRFTVGDYILGNLGWREYWISNGSGSDIMKIDQNLAPIQWYLKGCRVIGSTGSQEKVRWLLDQARIDHAFNYRDVGENNISYELQRSYPDGIDLYFDNVGGKHLEAALDNMKPFGRIVLCGMISQYNLPSTPIGISNLFLAVRNRLKLQGFIVRDHYDIMNEFYADMSDWIGEEKIKWKETVIEGIENAPKAFLALFKGENIGKMLVKIGF
jgi:NADPH-dependent curcumin reductase CurA